ncbi:protein kinase domain protein, partial [Ichthyophthirius multifiliis]
KQIEVISRMLEKRAQTTNTSPKQKQIQQQKQQRNETKIDLNNLLLAYNQQINDKNSYIKPLKTSFQQQQLIIIKYEGEYLRKMRHGTGCCYYSNNYIYEGEWKSGKRNGYGILKDEFGIDIYNGEWQNDLYNGQGRLRNQNVCYQNYIDFKNLSEKEFSSCQFYTGNFLNGVMHGHGTLIFCNNDKFIGIFQSGKVHGEGAYYIHQGLCIKGIWQNSKL